MKFGIDIGHNCPPDTGARGIKFEDNLTTEVGNKVMEKLRSLGNEVVDCKPKSASSVGRSLAGRCDAANRNRVDLFVSIHFNAFNGRANGTEVFAISDNAKKIAQPVLNEIIKLGFFNRGVKNGSHLYVLRNTNMPAILIECCFIDSAKDMELYDGEAMADAIVKGLTGKVPTASEPVKTVPDDGDNPDKTVLRIQKSLNQLKITDRNNKPLVEDNAMGPATTSAIEKFQKIVGIMPTGIAGSTFWEALNQIIAKRVIRVNHAGAPVVRYLQFRVGVDIDGIYGPQSEAAMKKYQAQNGLTSDGIVGPMTWAKLLG
ncbi:peptidoglycan-binding domain protein 1 [Richelia sinica FACHB-800]|uniref:Peptidoglycan-binding domain protein 1 n=1 Tax=Richelia sinica FACHB-800 TaxID=1357546 RepID=A0A975TB62_9NOST|nr:N-acetylmuramoyl-L-alanine amidase [Richelia sinica]MBD2666403.1 N-acetylmuramoyl-L-alanine amidase [Richelia sinica FACHB-800]QXE25507.1 peptidoglycan-binding domain protein 1 [Richelia sinica FACHB-800]